MDENRVEVTSDQKETPMSGVKAFFIVVGFAPLGAFLGFVLSWPAHALTMPDDTYGWGLLLFWYTLPPVGAATGVIVGDILSQK